MLRPDTFISLSMHFAGAIAKSMGATAASSYATILANGFSPLSLAAYSLMSTKAQAPSLIFDALAAVIVPFLANAGLSEANLSGINFWHSSSLSNFFSPLRSYIVTSTISQSRIPASCAALALL